MVRRMKSQRQHVLRNLGVQSKAEAHVFSEPLYVVRPPAIVVKAEVNPASEVGLRIRKVDGRSFAKRHYWRVERLNPEHSCVIFVCEAG